MPFDFDNLLSHLDNARGALQEAESIYNGPIDDDDDNAIEVTLMSIAYSLLHIAERFPQKEHVATAWDEGWINGFECGTSNTPESAPDWNPYR